MNKPTLAQSDATWHIFASSKGKIKVGRLANAHLWENVTNLQRAASAILVGDIQDVEQV